MRFLVVVDMQNDFVTGVLGTEQAQKIGNNVEAKIKEFMEENKRLYPDRALLWNVRFTQDTHGEDYLDTQEGRKLPVKHCILGTWGWELIDQILPYAPALNRYDKDTFGCMKLADALRVAYKDELIDTIEIVGLCTDICVLNNAALLRAALPNTEIVVDAAACAGVTPETHETALNALEGIQVKVVNRGNEPWKE